MKPNIERLSLKSLRDHLNATTLDVSLPDDDGDVHAMVFVPRFTIPAGLIAEGVPSRALHLGGFLVDKYPATTIGYVGGALKAASRPLGSFSIVPGHADEYAALRTFGGQAVSVMGVREWGHLAWLVALLGHTLKGNTQSRRDARDPDEWASYADRVGALQFTVPGSGPLSWFHNGLPSGIVDLLGNLPHFLATDGAAPASLLVVREAVLSDPDGITDEDTDFYISNPRHGYDSWFSFENWPESNGLIRIDNELVSYGTLTIDENDASIAHLTNCTRGRYGTSAASHAEDAAMQLERWHTVAPGSYAAKLAAGIDDQVGQLGLDWNAFSHGARDANPTIGDVLCLENEDVLVTGINGTDLAVTRGHNGTTPAAHLAGAFVVKYPTTMTRAQQGYVSGFATGAVRTHVDLEPLYLPAACQAAEPAGIQPYVQFSLKDAAAWYVLRGAPNQRNAAESQLSLQVLSGASVPNGNQWRCVRYVS